MRGRTHLEILHPAAKRTPLRGRVGGRPEEPEHLSPEGVGAESIDRVAHAAVGAALRDKRNLSPEQAQLHVPIERLRDRRPGRSGRWVKKLVKEVVV